MKPAILIIAAAAAAACGGSGPTSFSPGSSPTQPFSGSYTLRVIPSGSCNLLMRQVEWRVQTTVSVVGVALLSLPGGGSGVTFEADPIDLQARNPTYNGILTVHDFGTQERYLHVDVLPSVVRGAAPTIVGGRARRYEGGFSGPMYIQNDEGTGGGCVAADHRLVLEAL